MENTYNQRKSLYIHRNGQEKFDKLYSKVLNSNILARLEGMSIHGGIAPSAKDFCLIATHIPTILMRFDQDTNIMCALIALKIWDEKINRVYQMADAYEISAKAMNIIRINQ